jgi:hypothetical protein
MLFVGIVALPHLVLLAFQLTGVAFQPNKSAGFAIASVLWGLASAVVSLGVVAASQGATVVAVSHIHLDRPISIMESFAGMKGKILYVALIMIGYWIGIAVGFVLLIIPGIILALMWALTIPVAVLEDKGLRDSVNRSAELTKGHRGRIFVIYLLFMILFYAVIMAWEIPILGAIGVFAHNANIRELPIWSQVAIPVCGFLTQCLVAPLMTIGFSLVYYDERVRKEAFDLQHMMASLDGAPGQTAGAPA